MTRPFFSKDRVSHFDIFDRHAADAIKQVKARVGQGYAVDVQVNIHAICSHLFLPFSQDVVSRFTLDSATEFLFGMFVLAFGVSCRSKYSQPFPQGYLFTLGRVDLPAFRPHPVLSRSPGGQIRGCFPDRKLRGLEAKSVESGLETRRVLGG
jgi:hypothetical protein